MTFPDLHAGAHESFILDPDRARHARTKSSWRPPENGVDDRRNSPPQGSKKEPPGRASGQEVLIPLVTRIPRRLHRRSLMEGASVRRVRRPAHRRPLPATPETARLRPQGSGTCEISMFTVSEAVRRIACLGPSAPRWRVRHLSTRHPIGLRIQALFWGGCRHLSTLRRPVPLSNTRPVPSLHQPPAPCRASEANGRHRAAAPSGAWRLLHHRSRTRAAHWRAPEGEQCVSVGRAGPSPRRFRQQVRLMAASLLPHPVQPRACLALSPLPAPVHPCAASRVALVSYPPE